MIQQTVASPARRSLAVMLRATEGINRLDPDLLIEACRPDVEWWSALATGSGGLPYLGHAGLCLYLEELERTWEHLHIEVQEHRQIGDRQIAICDITAHARGSARDIAQQSALAYTLRGGFIQSAWGYLDPADAMADYA